MSSPVEIGSTTRQRWQMSGRKRTLLTGLSLLGSDVSGRQAAVDKEGRPVHVAGLVAGQEQRRVGDLARLGEPAHRQMHSPALVRARILVEDAHKQRRLD